MIGPHGPATAPATQDAESEKLACHLFIGISAVQLCAHASCHSPAHAQSALLSSERATWSARMIAISAPSTEGHPVIREPALPEVDVGTASRLGLEGQKRSFPAHIPVEVEATWSGS